MSKWQDWNGSAVFEQINGWKLRLRLDRWWDDRPRALVCMANPSYAGVDKNDPTINRLFDLCWPLGVGGFTVVNWEPYIATDPKDLHAWRWNAADQSPADYDRVRKMNLHRMRELARHAPIRIIAWGTIVPQVPLTTAIMAAMSIDFQHDLFAFDLTKDGSPKHPMARGLHRIPNDAKPVIFRRARTGAGQTHEAAE